MGGKSMQEKKFIIDIVVAIGHNINNKYNC
jgi:hypothetical protein